MARYVKAGRLSEALSRFMDLPKVRSRDESKEREVVHAELLQLTGSNEEARDVASGLLRTAVSEALQARCQLVLGQVCPEREHRVIRSDTFKRPRDWPMTHRKCSLSVMLKPSSQLFLQTSHPEIPSSD